VDSQALHRLLDDVAAGRVAPDDALATIRHLPFADLGFARVDHHRSVRTGLSEVVYGPGKTPDQCVAIIGELLAASAAPVLLSRTADDQAQAALETHPGGERFDGTVVWQPAPPRPEQVALVTAGTADLPVADECAVVLAAHGVAPIRVTDVGVSGLHRLLAETATLQSAQVVVVVAGMEGALPSVVGGLTAAPVVAVPTSVGYGAALDGVTALLSMLASCAAGITVVGIDNGFGAAYAVLRLIGTVVDQPR
jgi:NCAIR mutase (PurE)-related protein